MATVRMRGSSWEIWCCAVDLFRLSGLKLKVDVGTQFKVLATPRPKFRLVLSMHLTKSCRTSDFDRNIISQPWRLDPTRRPTRSLVVHSSQLVCTYTPTTEHELVSAYVYGNSNFDRSDSELKIVGEYGLRNKREVWRVQLTLSKIRRAAR